MSFGIIMPETTIEPCKSAEQNVADVPSGDLISRAEVFEIIDKAFSQPMRDGNTIYADICLMLNVLPTHANSRSTHDTDLISRVEALDVVCKELQYQEENRIPYDSYDSGTCYGLKTARELLLALPSADRPQVNSNSAEEQIAEICDRPKEDDKPQPYVPEASTERVVHCKDCVYSEEIRDGNDMFACNNMNGMPGYVRGDDFCSSGSL